MSTYLFESISMLGGCIPRSGIAGSPYVEGTAIAFSKVAALFYLSVWPSFFFLVGKSTKLSSLLIIFTKTCRAWSAFH